jgi:hypothetical protein
MKLLVRRREAALAERRLQCARDIWNVKTTTIRASLSRHRKALAAGMGLFAGLLCGVVPRRAVARLGRFFASFIGLAVRIPIETMLVESAKNRARSQAGPPQDPV